MSERPVALVTGAAKRLGRHLASRLADKGFHVLVNYRNSQREADTLVSEIQGLGGSARATRADISDKTMVADMFGELTSNEGRLDLLINNVGNYSPGPVRELSPDRWDECIGANLSGAYYCCYEAFALLEASGGQIINIGYAGLEQNLGTPGAVGYQVSKMGLLSLTRSLALALAPAVRVNMVSPGQLEDSIDLPINLAASIPLARAGRHQDVASAVDFLLGASYVTGHNLDVAGGYRLGGP
jgi:NAD(P)-dependent dehydrogenase (short-subunit alcohol dehydrogenase family)